jgi:hypothetical protein
LDGEVVQARNDRHQRVEIAKGVAFLEYTRLASLRDRVSHTHAFAPWFEEETSYVGSHDELLDEVLLALPIACLHNLRGHPPTHLWWRRKSEQLPHVKD